MNLKSAYHCMILHCQLPTDYFNFEIKSTRQLVPQIIVCVNIVTLSLVGKILQETCLLAEIFCKFSYNKIFCTKV